jgi:bifunctional DNA-binding transcriptional regulator/antitoxin component of YhaV-PrlF toxin-antitoxin module
MGHIYVRKVQIQGTQHVINIPFDIRRHLGVGKGDHLYFELVGSEVRMGTWMPEAKGATTQKGATDEAVHRADGTD